MQPEELARDVHPGLVGMHDGAPGHFPLDLLTGCCQALGPLPHDLYQRTGRDRLPRHIEDHLAEPLVRQQLIRVQIEHECPQAGSVLHRRLNLLRKSTPRMDAAEGTSLLDRTVLGHLQGNRREVEDLSAQEGAGWALAQIHPATATMPRGVLDDHVGAGHQLEPMPLVTGLPPLCLSRRWAGRRLLAHHVTRGGPARVATVLPETGFHVREPFFEGGHVELKVIDLILQALDERYDGVEPLVIRRLDLLPGEPHRFHALEDIALLTS